MGALVVNIFTSLDGILQGPFPKGAVHLTYERAGKPTFTSMA